MDRDTPERSPGAHTRRLDTWLGLAVTALGALVYLNTLHGEFVFDDIKLIVNNDIVKDPSRLGDVLFTNLWGLLGRGSNYYRPLPPLAFMLIHAWFGSQPAPFHVLNIVLHAGSTGLVLLVSRRLLAVQVGADRARWPALAAAVLFAVHPIHTEAVAWISGVMDLACTFFALLCLYLYIAADDRRWRLPLEGVSLVALLLALLSKEPAAVVPLLLVAYDVLFCRHRVRTLAAALRRWMPPLIVLAGYLALRAYSLGGAAPFRHDAQGSALEVILTLPRLFALYVQKLAVPVELNVVYDLAPVTTPAEPVFLLALIVILLLAALSWVLARQSGIAAFGLVVFVLALAPALYVPALSQDLSKAFAERYVYFPSAGAAFLLAGGLAALERRGGVGYRAALAVVAIVSLVFAGLTVSRNAVWRDSVALWSDCVRKSPNLALAHESLGLALIRRGQPQEGANRLQTALRLAPELPGNWVESGIRAARTGLGLQAILSFQTALLYRPDLVEAHYNLSLAFEQMGWVGPAMQQYRATLARDPGHADARNNLGVLLGQQGQIDDAIEQFRAAVRARPSDAELRMNLARAYQLKGMTAEAQQQRALAGLADVGLGQDGDAPASLRR